MKTQRFLEKCIVVAGFSLFVNAYAKQETQKPGLGEYGEWDNRPAEEFSDPAKGFALVKEKLLSAYFDTGVTEAELYRLAVKGMLEGLNQKGKSWNKLYSPSEYKELTGDLAGKVVGVGLKIKFDSERGNPDVISIIPNSPAEKVGLTAGDQILKVNGKSFKGQNLRDVVYAIRGKAGERVTLTVLRDDKVFTKSLMREGIPWNTVDYAWLPPSTGLISIHAFSENTPNQLKEAIRKVVKKETRSLILDLRDNQGGVFEKAIESIEMFLPEGKPIVKTLKRGNTTETLLARGKPLVAGIPIAVLVDGSTSCGAEIMAEALRENLQAPLVGHRTFGKWNAQSVEELPNGYAYKFTSNILETPSGQNRNGVGLEPDIAVDLSEETRVDSLQVMKDLDKRLSLDQPLRTAVSVLKIKAP